MISNVALWRNMVFKLIFLTLWIKIAHAMTLTNVTIDETSPLITYVPSSSWSRIMGDLDAGGGHMLTEDKSAFATITFTCFSFYFMSPKWPYHVSTQLSINSAGSPANETVKIDLQDHSVPDVGGGGGTKQSTVVFSHLDTESRTRTIRVSVPPGDQYAILDRFIFEVEDTSTSTAPTSTSLHPTTTTQLASASNSSTPSAPASASSKPSTSRADRTLAISLGILGPILAVLVGFVIWFFCCFRRKARRRAADDLGYEDEKAGFGLNHPAHARALTITHPHLNPFSPIDPGHAAARSYDGQGQADASFAQSFRSTHTPENHGPHPQDPFRSPISASARRGGAASPIPPRITTPSPIPSFGFRNHQYGHQQQFSSSSYGDSSYGHGTGHGHGLSFDELNAAAGYSGPGTGPAKWEPYVPAPLTPRAF